MLCTFTRLLLQKDGAELFNKILIANRGEIAVRVARTAREMGIKTVAVYSELDRDALHVRVADEAFALGGSTPQESYLNTEKILEILELSDADALHPGYGFFSENAEFARSISNTGVTFIGPPPEAIEIMGDKISSRIAAQKAGVEGVPGTTTVVTDYEEVIDFGQTHGWPVAIKAAYGGGGRGMRVVRSKEEAKDALESAMRESEKAFGRSECYLERYLTWPRHIEMQIFADDHENALWIGERDCSCQRRHQKLIEEAPAPNFPDDVREKMGEAAVRVAKACGYKNAGTVEFLYQDNNFYFLEMNTRLQVEHPVTELITGLDLVEWQILVASGQRLPLAQHEIQRRGSSIEVRVNAEDPSGGRFLPSPGTITKFIRPDGPYTRTDTGYESGDTVSQFYDNLVAKVVVWAETRDKAINKMVRVLKETEIEGISTTIPAHLTLLQHPEFRNIEYSTKWVETRAGLESLQAQTPASVETSEALTRTKVLAEVNGKRVEVNLYLPENDRLLASQSSSKTRERARGSTLHSHHAPVGGGSGQITVPMQGTVVKVLVDTGQDVEVGQSLLVLEAMKMENAILSEKSGVVKEVRVKAGDTVGTGDTVVVIE